MSDAAQDASIVREIAAVGNNQRKEIVFEGVETVEQWKRLNSFVMREA